MPRKKKEATVENVDAEVVIDGMNAEEAATLSPAEYFNMLKGKKEEMSKAMLDHIYENAMTLMKRYKITGQKLAMKKLMFYVEKIEKEKMLVDKGYTTFIYKDTIEDYIDNVADGVVKIVELENYERDLPDEVIDIVADVQDIFTNLYVIFTDYTGKAERKVKAHRREKDPILVGGFMLKDSMGVSERLYLLADWVDQYCDLTLEKMISQMKSVKKLPPLHEAKIPESIDEMKKELGSIRSHGGLFNVSNLNDEDGNWTITNSSSSYTSYRD